MTIHLHQNDLPDGLDLGPVVAIDTETTSIDAMRADLVGISWSVKPGEAAYVPLRHNGPDAPLQLQPEEVQQARFIAVEQALAEAQTQPYCPDSLRALKRYLAR